MPVTYDTVSSAGLATASLSWSHTTAVDADMLYVFAGGWDGTARTATCTYGGIAMTLIATTALSNVNDIEWCFKLPAPPTGTNTVVVTIGGGAMAPLFGTAFSVKGAHQTLSRAPVTVASTVNGAAVSVTVTDSAVGELILDACIEGAALTNVVNGPASHTERVDQSISGGETQAAGTSDGAAGSTVVGWTASNPASWVHIAVSVRAADEVVPSHGIRNPVLRPAIFTPGIAR